MQVFLEHWLPKILTNFNGTLPLSEVRFASFLSGVFTTMAVINPPERKMAKRTSVGALCILIQVESLEIWCSIAPEILTVFTYCKRPRLLAFRDHAATFSWFTIYAVQRI